MAATTFRDRTRSAKQQARRLVNEAKNRRKAARRRLQAASGRLLAITPASVRHAQSVVEALRAEGRHQAARLAETVESFLPRVEQALDQTARRVFAGEAVPAGEKIRSLFEPHSATIRRNKAGKATEFGRNMWLDEVDGGIVTRWEVRDGNPADEHQWRPAIDPHLERFGKPPDLASADQGLDSPQNKRYARSRRVKRIILPKSAPKSQTRRDDERQGWFKRGRRWHAGAEGRMSVLHRKHGLDRCRDKGETGVEKWVGWAMIAGHLAVIGQKLAANGARVW